MLMPNVIQSESCKSDRQRNKTMIYRFIINNTIKLTDNKLILIGKSNYVCCNISYSVAVCLMDISSFATTNQPTNQDNIHSKPQSQRVICGRGQSQVLSLFEPSSFIETLTSRVSSDPHFQNVLRPSLPECPLTLTSRVSSPIQHTVAHVVVSPFIQLQTSVYD